MLYPLLHGAFVDTKISMDAKEFLDQRQGAAADLGQESQSSNVPPDKTMPYPELFAAMQAYNARIWEERQSQLCDPWSYQQPSFSLEEYDKNLGEAREKLKTVKVEEFAEKIVKKTPHGGNAMRRGKICCFQSGLDIRSLFSREVRLLTPVF